MVWEELVLEARLYLLLFGRIVGLLRTAPLLSSRAVPVLARGALALFSALAVRPLVGNLYSPLPEAGLIYLFILASEVLLGILMGLFLQLVFAAFQTAGQLFSVQMGFGASQVFDPLAQVEIPLLGQFLNLVGLAIFLMVSGLQRLFLHGLAGSFRALRGMDLLLQRDFLQETLLRAIGGLFEQALVLAFPILGTLILISVTMGLLAKAAPQMNLLMIGFPLQIGVGFIMFFMAAPFLAEKMSQLVDLGFRQLQLLFTAYTPGSSL